MYQGFWSLTSHSSEIRGLRSAKCSSETLQYLLYFMYKKTHVFFFDFHFVQLYIFTLWMPWWGNSFFPSFLVRNLKPRKGLSKLNTCPVVHSIFWIYLNLYYIDTATVLWKWKCYVSMLMYGNLLEDQIALTVCWFSCRNSLLYGLHHHHDSIAFYK